MDGGRSVTKMWKRVCNGVLITREAVLAQHLTRLQLNALQQLLVVHDVDLVRTAHELGHTHLFQEGCARMSAPWARRATRSPRCRRPSGTLQRSCSSIAAWPDAIVPCLLEDLPPGEQRLSRRSSQQVTSPVRAQPTSGARAGVPELTSGAIHELLVGGGRIYARLKQTLRLVHQGADCHHLRLDGVAQVRSARRSWGFLAKRSFNLSVSSLIPV